MGNKESGDVKGGFHVVRLPEAGQPKPITVRTETVDDGFRISVHNGGTPIPAQLLPTLFEPMVRGHAPGAKGVGLGLYIVRAIVQAHGGQVSASSSAGEGTTFRMDLPAG